MGAEGDRGGGGQGWSLEKDSQGEHFPFSENIGGARGVQEQIFSEKYAINTDCSPKSQVEF